MDRLYSTRVPFCCVCVSMDFFFLLFTRIGCVYIYLLDSHSTWSCFLSTVPIGFLLFSSSGPFAIWFANSVPQQQGKTPLPLCCWDYAAAPLADIQQHSFRVWSFRHGLGVVSIQHRRRLSLSSSFFLLAFAFYIIIHMPLCISWSLLFLISKVILADEITSSSFFFLNIFAFWRGQQRHNLLANF